MPGSLRAATSLAALAACAIAFPLGAQRTLADVALPVGARVRVTAPEVIPERVVGRVISRDTLGLTLNPGRGRAHLSFAPTEVRVLEVSRGRHRWAWALLGAGVGTLGGASLGAHLGSRNDTNGLATAAGFVLGGLAGFVGGAAIGAVAAPESWRRYDFSAPG